MDAPSTIAVLAEKPSVARDIAAVLGANKRGEGFLHGGGYVVTWAIGHLASLAQPHEIHPEWKAWRRDTLPMLPAEWPLVAYEKTKDQFEAVRRILCSPKVASVVCATDAGREGELIFRYIYEATGCAKPVSRLWISSLTPEAIRRGLAQLKPANEYDPLADAARGRSRADWLVGMNLSRAYSLAYDDELSVGRVQTPTLAMVVERELAVRAFVPEDYIEVIATFRPAAKPEGESYEGTWFRDAKDVQGSARLKPDGVEAEEIIGRARRGQAAIESVRAQKQRMAPPLLYDLTELQRHANRLYGFSAQKVLDLAQALYERHKLITYPRTDSRHLSHDVASTLPAVVRAIAGHWKSNLAPGTGERPLTGRFVDDAKVTDHHAIIPTTVTPRTDLASDERKIYEMICRRLLMAWHDDHVWSVTTVITAIRNAEVIDRYHSSGKTIEHQGWKVLDPIPERKQKGEDSGDDRRLPTGLADGQAQDVLDAEAAKKKTRPPKRFTEATLLTAMETAGKTLDDKELSDAMKESGLGTPATRASIIETLLKRAYITRSGRTLEATDKGISLIGVVHPEVRSPAMTGQWEARLKQIERGREHLAPFMKGIEDYVTDVVGKVKGVPLATRPSAPTPTPQPAATPVVAATAEESLDDLLHRAFGFSTFRANQEEVCRTLIAGRDVLLVMPTGAGKSLCYQLPGLARGGTTLVVSPLIALMEDQASRLRQLGFAVECIHSGRDRAASRQACIDYLAGKLQFLMIAPERLRVAGFPEMLAKRKPSLIAIDEAHCISQWGHDFRPDYRLLGGHLPALRPAPVIALTATATPIVQRDIRAQLGLTEAADFVHGFRRENIAIEVVETNPSQRPDLVLELLTDEARRPAIVYTPSRKQAEAVAQLLNREFPAAAYHAGLDADRRHRAQREFLSGKTQVIVATIAFGMGIDKPDIRTVIHTALPGSMEAYYQEIGRAGRDGNPSRAILMHSYADRHTHDFFFNQSYPEVTVLDQIFRRLTADDRPRDLVERATRLPADVFETALEKLWLHGGAMVDAADNLRRAPGEPDVWRDSYVAQGERRKAQIEEMIRYAQSGECRMSTLVRHFGDTGDSARACGICDFCAPDQCVAQRYRPASFAEEALARRVLAELEATGRSAGQLHGALAGDGSRDEFEELLGAMARAGYVRLTDAVFEKDGRQIPYRKVYRTRDAEYLDEESPLGLTIREGPATTTTGKKRRGKQAAPQAKKVKAARKVTREDSKAEELLRKWRAAAAKKQGVPAFRIMTDKTLAAIAEDRPRNAAELLAVSGIGMKTVEKYGAQIYRILNEVDHK